MMCLRLRSAARRESKKWVDSSTPPGRLTIGKQRLEGLVSRRPHAKYLTVPYSPLSWQRFHRPYEESLMKITRIASAICVLLCTSAAHAVIQDTIDFNSVPQGFYPTLTVDGVTFY